MPGVKGNWNKMLNTIKGLIITVSYTMKNYQGWKYMSKSKKEAYSKKISLTIDILQEKFPSAFPRKPAPKVPLAMGTTIKLCEMISNGELDVKAFILKSAIKCWCSSIGYYAVCMTAGSPRYDLNGEPKGVVLERHAKYAQDRLAERMCKYNEKVERN